MKAYVMIKIRAGNVTEVVRRLHQTAHVLEASMTSGPYDALAVIELPDLGGVGTIIT
jgi:hypothetical protein